MFPSMLSGDLFSHIDRLQREMQQVFGMDPDIRGLVRGGFPTMNIGSTPQSIEVYAFIPGIDPNSIDVHLERGVLTLSGERQPEFAGAGAGAAEQVNLHVNERFAGRFRKVISLSDDIDPDGVTAQCRDGVLHISVRRRQEMQPRRISVQ